jgi:UDP-N-acetyl-D-galactosamine dehydrogenase
LAVNHSEYCKYNELYFKSLMKNQTGVFVDVKGIYRGQIQDLTYWSL